MCGIVGAFNLNGEDIQEKRIKKMLDSILHRGPDGEGIYVSSCVGLGHRRLSIIDLSEDGAQPMSNENGTIWVTFNGEIYNFKDIKKDLETRGHIFRSKTDTEVIVHAYEEYGIECIHQFNGMFAFAIWDSNKHMMWLVRDRLGVKPLFYLYSKNSLLFASEIKAILTDSDVERSIDFESLAYYFALNYTPAPYTLFSNIRQLLPGHYIRIDMNGHMEHIKYWDIVYDEQSAYSKKHYIEEFNNLFDDSVKSRLVSDVPFGAFLSGGLDSSTVSYFMSRNMNEKVKTFSIGFSEQSYNETGYAREVSKSIGSEHYEEILKPDTVNILRKIVWHSEEPTADSSMLAVYYLAQLARRHVKMVLSGDGADEIFAGYETYQAYYVLQLYRLIPEALRNRVIEPFIRSMPVSHSKMSTEMKLKRFINGAKLSGEDAHAYWRIIFDSDMRAKLFSPVIESKPKIKSDIIDLYRQTFAATNARNSLNRMLYVDTRFYLPNDMLVKVDRMTMAHGLEARVPFLDYRLVEFAASVPPNMKLNNFTNKKYIIKACMAGKLPESVLGRKKAGFNLPVNMWIKESLKTYVTDILSKSSIQDMGIFDTKTVEQLLKDHFDEKADNSHQIWCLLIFTIWWQTFIKN